MTLVTISRRQTGVKVRPEGLGYCGLSEKWKPLLDVEMLKKLPPSFVHTPRRRKIVVTF